LRLIREFRAANWGFGNVNVSDKAVAATRNSFHEAGAGGGVTERLTDFVDRFIESVVKVHEGVGRPEFFLKFLARYDFAVVLEQHHQDSKRLFLKPGSQTMFPQLARLEIQFEGSKSERPAKLTVLLHKEVNPCGKGVYHQTESAETQEGISSIKSFIKNGISGEINSI
jgi:hypothetical protein